MILPFLLPACQPRQLLLSGPSTTGYYNSGTTIELSERNNRRELRQKKLLFFIFYLAMEKIFASGSFHHPVSSRRFGRLAPRIPRLGAVPGNDFERSLMMTILATGSFHHQQSSNAMPSAVGDFFLLLPPSGENLGHLKKRSRPTYRAKNRFQGR